MQAQERLQKEHEETRVPGQQVAERLNDELWTSGKAVLGTEKKKKREREGILFFFLFHFLLNTTSIKVLTIMKHVSW